MTDYELVTLVTQSIINTATLFMHLFTLLSAYVLAGYVFAPNITKRMYGLLNALFVITFLIMASTAYASLLHVRSLNLQIRERESLSWNVITWMPSWLEAVLIGLLPIVFIFILGGAMAFFHSSRMRKKPTLDQ